MIRKDLATSGRTLKQAPQQVVCAPMRFALVLILTVACGAGSGGGPPLNNQLAGPATDGTTFAAELASMMGSIADATCACKEVGCGSGNAMAAMVLMRDLGDVIRKVPSEESTFTGSEEQTFGKVDPMAGLDSCWATRAEWEMARAGNCYARLNGDKKPDAQAAAPRCPAVARPAAPKLDEWWKSKRPCPSGDFEDTRTDSFHVKRCVSDGVTQGRETRWWLYNKMPAYEQTATGWTYWYPDGKRAATQSEDKATRTTTLLRWYPNGNKRDERTYVGDEGQEEAGKRIDYWPNGNKRAERTYRGTHVRTYWYANGTKAAEVGFSDEAHHGPFTFWHPNGQIKQTGRYRFAQEHGVFEEFDEAGKSIKREQYNYGQSGEAPKDYGKPKVTAASLLTEDLVRALGGQSGAVVAEETEETDSTRDNIRYRAPDKPAAFDVQLSLWGSGGVTPPRSYFDQLRSDLGKVSDLKLADQAFVGTGTRAISVVFYDKRGLTVLVECGTQRCRTSEDAIKLATSVYAKIPARI